MISPPIVMCGDGAEDSLDPAADIFNFQEIILLFPLLIQSLQSLRYEKNFVFVKNQLKSFSDTNSANLRSMLQC